MNRWLALGLSEFVGTALLILVGCSFVVLDFAPKSPVVHWLPSLGVRRALTGFLFGSTGGAIAVSPVGKVSGAHINPVVSLAFWFQKKLTTPMFGVYVVAQCLGAVAGAWALTSWGPWASSIHDAATLPGVAGNAAALLGETLATLCLVSGLLLFVGHSQLRRYTPAIFAPMYAVLVFLEAGYSGTSTNPARSLGPAVIAHCWTGWWIYWLGPTLGSLLGVLLVTRWLPLRQFEIEVAKLYHFNHDPHQFFHQRSFPSRQGLGS